jgi:hypothetical protein
MIGADAASNLRLLRAGLVRIFTPDSKPHFMLTLGAPVDANVRIRAIRRCVGADNFHFVSRPAQRQIGASGLKESF